MKLLCRLRDAERERERERELDDAERLRRRLFCFFDRLGDRESLSLRPRLLRPSRPSSLSPSLLAVEPDLTAPPLTIPPPVVPPFALTCPVIAAIFAMACCSAKLFCDGGSGGGG